VNETEEWFYQLKGAMLLRIVENNGFRDVHIKEGEMFMLPGQSLFQATWTPVASKYSRITGNTPHNPVRFADTTGLVMERVRPEESLDRLRWYCENGGHESPTVIREDVFHVTDLGTQLKSFINAWMTKEELRKCPECGEVADPK
jgi:3-hydroxyanthranilate 3,4-dioxygenase